MLILSRRRDEAVMIGDLIRVVVVEIRDGKVRLGFEAPRDVPVHREEVWLDIQSEQSGPGSDAPIC